MKKSSVIVLSTAVAVVFLAACESSKDSRNSGSNRFGHRGSPAASGTEFASPTPTPEGFTEETATVEAYVPPTTPTPTPPPAPTASRDLSYGIPVPGKAGFVTSPHAPYAGYVDARGFPPGTEVKCPYSGKIFLVP
jgi:hypothetical protein